jgi:hypothetical protein
MVFRDIMTKIRARRTSLIEKRLLHQRREWRPRKPVGYRTIGAGWSSPVARQAHNLKVTGSNPVPATNPKARDANALAGFFARQ